MGVAARIPTGMPVPLATHLAAGQLVDSVVEEAVVGGDHGDDVQTESVDFAEADLHSVPFSPKEGEMRVSSVLHHLVAVSTELQLGAVFTSHQSLQMGGVEEPGMDSDCDTDSVHSEHSAHSVDSGLEESGHSNLEVEGGIVMGELIYENTSALKSNAYLTPVTTAIEKYQFGGHAEEEEEEEDDNDAAEKSDDEEEEEEEEEKQDSDEEGVLFPPLDLTSNNSHQGERSSNKLWGVRSHGGAANGLLGPQVVRTSNPTEDKIAKEIRELKEREEELVRRREMSKSPTTTTTTTSVHPRNPSPSLASTTRPSSPVKSTPTIKSSPPSPSHAPPHHHVVQEKPKSSEKFNPSNYRPLLPPGGARPRIMEDFISNGGRVTAFAPPDPAKELVTLRKPTVHKSVPKVQAPTALARQPTGTVLDKIQAELAETRRREEELKRSRRQQLSRSQPDLTKVLPTGPEKTFEHCPDPESPSEDEDEPSSLLQTRGKSALISVWESRIQSEQTA